MSGGKDVTFALLPNLAVIFIAVITQSILAWYLGPELRGSYAVALMFGTFLGVFFAIGLDAGIQFYVASKIITISEAISAALIIVIMGSLIGFFVGYGLLNSNFSFLDKAEPTTFKIALLQIPVSMLLGFFPNLMIGVRNFKGMAVFTLAQATIQLIFISIAVAIFGFGINGILCAAIVAGVLTIFGEMLYLWRNTNFQICLPSQPKLLMIFNYGLRHHFARLSNLVNFQIGTLVLAFIATAEEIGYFVIATIIMGQVIQLPTAISKALLPRVAEDEEGKSELIAMMFRFSATICGVVILIIILIKEPLITLLFSPSFKTVAVLIPYLALGILVRSATKVIIPYFNGTNHPEITSYAVFTGLIVNIVFVLVLYPIFGLPGAALAMTMGYIISGIILCYFFMRFSGITLLRLIVPRITDMNKTKEIINSLFKS